MDIKKGGIILKDKTLRIASHRGKERCLETELFG